MTTYAVRLKGSNEAVGIFSAENKRELWWVVDWVTDPISCEYMTLKRGGLLWEDRTKLKFDENAIEIDEEGAVFDGFSVGGWLEEIAVSKRWKGFTDADTANALKPLVNGENVVSFQ